MHIVTLASHKRRKINIDREMELPSGGRSLIRKLLSSPEAMKTEGGEGRGKERLIRREKDFSFSPPATNREKREEKRK